MADQRETSCDHIAGEKTSTFYSSEQKWINKLNKLKEKYPDEVQIVSRTEDSILVHIPHTWFKISPPRQMSDEQKQAAGERMRQMWANGDMKKE